MFPNCFPQNNTRKPLDKVSHHFRTKILPIYWAFLTYMLLKPGTENQEYWFMFPGIDKLIHISIFIALGFCFMAAFPKMKFWRFVQLMLIYAFLTEILQDVMNMGRSSETLDVVADLAGTLLGFWVYKKIKSIWI